MRRLSTLLFVAALLAVSCGSEGSADEPQDTDSPVPVDSTTTPPTTEPPTTTTTEIPSTTQPAVEDPASIANPDRPWVREQRDDLITRSGINIEAANCVVDRFEQEGFDMRLLLWSDDSTPLVVGSVIGLCGSTLIGGYDLAPFTADGAENYGDDITLDRLWDWCEAGDGAACDELWWTSDSDTAYETFADSCGNRGGSGTECLDVLPISSYGDSPLLDLWYDSCADGYGNSCDNLQFLDESAGSYATFGQTCGERVTDEIDPDCVAIIAGIG